MIQVIQADCLSMLRTYPDNHFALAFVDPPFNIGQAYGGYHDKRPASEFAAFITSLCQELYRVCGGVLALHGPDTLVDLYLPLALREGWRRITWVNMAYNFGICHRRNFIDARTHLLVYGKHATHCWNPEEILIESARVRYKDKRVTETERGGSRVPGTIWGLQSDESSCVVEPLVAEPFWGRVPGNSKERVATRPNQLPEVYLERILRAYTNPGDLCLDPCAGTGTLGVVAAALNRRAVLIDSDPGAVTAMQQRLARGAVRVSQEHL